MLLAILQWFKGGQVDPAILLSEYGRMLDKNDYLVEVGKGGILSSKVRINRYYLHRYSF